MRCEGSIGTERIGTGGVGTATNRARREARWHGRGLGRARDASAAALCAWSSSWAEGASWKLWRVETVRRQLGGGFETGRVESRSRCPVEGNRRQPLLRATQGSWGRVVQRRDGHDGDLRRLGTGMGEAAATRRFMLVRIWHRDHDEPIGNRDQHPSCGRMRHSDK